MTNYLKAQMQAYMDAMASVINASDDFTAEVNKHIQGPLLRKGQLLIKGKELLKASKNLSLVIVKHLGGALLTTRPEKNNED